MARAKVEMVRELQLRFRPEVQARIDARPLVRRLTEAERAAREIERTKDYRCCICCEFLQPPTMFKSPIIAVCHQCCWRSAVYGRKISQKNDPEINAAMAVLRAMERTICKMR